MISRLGSTKSLKTPKSVGTLRTVLFGDHLEFRIGNPAARLKKAIQPKACLSDFGRPERAIQYVFQY